MATPTQAGLIGDTIVCYCGSSLSTSSAVVGTAIEFSAVNSYLNFDFSNSHLTITSTTSLGWGNFSNFFSGFNEDITDVFIFSNDGFTGGIVDNFSFDATKISLDMNTGRSGRSLIL